MEMAFLLGQNATGYGPPVCGAPPTHASHPTYTLIYILSRTLWQTSSYHRDSYKSTSSAPFSFLIFLPFSFMLFAHILLPHSSPFHFLWPSIVRCLLSESFSCSVFCILCSQHSGLPIFSLSTSLASFPFWQPFSAASMPNANSSRTKDQWAWLHIKIFASIFSHFNFPNLLRKISIRNMFCIRLCLHHFPPFFLCFPFIFILFLWHLILWHFMAIKIS